MTIISWRLVAIFALGLTLVVSGCTAWDDSESESTEIVVEGESDAAADSTEPEQPAGEISISERLAEDYGEAELVDPLDEVGETELEPGADEVDETELEPGADEVDREPERDDGEQDIEGPPEEAEPIDPGESAQIPISEQDIHENDDGTETVAIELPAADADSDADDSHQIDDPAPAVSSLQVEQGTVGEDDPMVRFHLGGEPVHIRFVDVGAIAVEVVDSNIITVTGDIGDEPTLIVQAQPDTVACETEDQQ